MALPIYLVDGREQLAIARLLLLGEVIVGRRL